MLKTCLTFLYPISPSRNRNGFRVKNIAITRSEISFRKKAFALCRNLMKAGAALCLAVAINHTASAQCNVFQNADAANPLLSVLDPTKKIAGFAFADINGDGLQDVYVDYLGDRNAQYDLLHLYKNIGTKTHPVYKEDKNTGFGKNLAGGQNGEMQFVDIDGDGDLDYFASDSTYYYYGGAHIFFYKNIGTAKEPHFVPSVPLAPILNTRYIQPFTIADIDSDGDYDFYAADAGPYLVESYYQRVYFNTGTPQQPVFTDNYVYYHQDDGALYRTYYDWNKDGLLDYFDVDNYFGQFHDYFKNIGPKNNPQYVLDNADGPKFTNGVPYRLIDLNNDGAPEVFGFNGHYSTLAPVAVIQDTIINNSGKQLTVLSSMNRNANYTYRWEYNSKTIPGATLAYISASKPGVYTLYVTDDCGTGVSLNDTLTKNGALAAQANDRITALTNATALPFAVTSYPNPFTNTFTLQLSGSGERAESIVKITDLTGRVFLSQRMSSASVQLGQRLSRGIYTIQVWQGGEMVYHTIMIKQ